MATLAQRLTAAEAAYESLVLGTMARVFVDQNGERIEYTAANRQGLQAYIMALQNQILNGTSLVAQSRPLRFIF